MTIITNEEIEPIIDQYGERLIRLAFLYVKNWSTAEDIIQETFIRYYQKADQFQGEAPLQTYLSKIAINLCHDHLKKWKNKNWISMDFLKSLQAKDKIEDVMIKQEINLGLPNKF